VTRLKHKGKVLGMLLEAGLRRGGVLPRFVLQWWLNDSYLNGHIASEGKGRIAACLCRAKPGQFVRSDPRCGCCCAAPESLGSSRTEAVRSPSSTARLRPVVISWEGKRTESEGTLHVVRCGRGLPLPFCDAYGETLIANASRTACPHT